ncbi:G2/mitotic-specific cyclin-B3-like [Mizuhopecten yessoensis]|uniref:G2/mitotic-specific cyclin-B3-like n=1 Tax=Mizuhopecten yessoensis TaxID=6573 RepID=UPI000B45DBB5|nr:G2/mitotic-specific cyclin-B3-like [Mizuhopecten yessoensis]
MLNARKQKTSQQNVEVKKGKSVAKIHYDAVSKAQVGGFKRHVDNANDSNQKRRAAFGDITNALNEKSQQLKTDLKKSKLPLKAVVAPLKAVVATTSKPPQPKPAKEVKQKIRPDKKRLKQSKEVLELDENVIQLSQESRSLTSSQESTSSSLSSSQESTSSSVSLSSSLSSSKTSLDDIVEDLNATYTKEEVLASPPDGVDDVDKENIKDIAQVALYATFIFEYYKERELKFMVPTYMEKQTSLTNNMRAILVDWLVEVQENFELNHETLYLAVKLVDMYLTTKNVSKERLQLVGAAALFISCKFDERCPPMVADFLYICDDAYTKNDFLAMERSVLKTIGFDIGMPLSYRFLRRYAKCARASMETLTLARYILELSLMEYDFLKYRESEMASACLCLAFRMKKCGEWNRTLEYYTGYQAEQLLPLMQELNTMVDSPSRQLTTIKSKYSHRVFYEVAKLPALKSDELTTS